MAATTAELFSVLNMIHPLRDRGGRIQRILFEFIIVNAGYELSWWGFEECEWIRANIDAVVCDYSALNRIFDRRIGQPVS